jgi:hypothetical protein
MLNNNQSVHTCRENGVYKLKRKLNKDIFNEYSWVCSQLL